MSGQEGWGTLFKCETSIAAPTPTDRRLQDLLHALPGPPKDKKLTGAGRDFTLWFWVSASDASHATQVGADLIRSASSEIGLPEIRIVRSHSASTNGRISPFPGTRERRDLAGVWSVLYRVQAPIGHEPIGEPDLERFRTALGEPDSLVTLHGDKEKFLISDGTSFTARFWATVLEPWTALREGRRRLVGALVASGLAEWTIVRAQVVTPGARDGDTFPGAYDRHPSETEETR